MAAHCLKEGVNPLVSNECVKGGHLLRQVYPQGSVPAYNYPIWWARAYAIFGDDSESFFIAAWRLNAAVLIAAICWLSHRYATWVLPVLLLNPVTLLTIERGNADAITFGVALLGWLRFRPSVANQLLGLGAASVLKVYPIFGFLALLPRWRDFRFSASGWLAVLLAPFLLLTLRDVPRYVSSTPQGYPFSYGLLAVRHAPQFSETSGGVILFGALVGVLFFALAPVMSAAWRRGVQDSVGELGRREVTCFAAFFTIHLCTFILFTNWAYRLVFLYPVFVLAMTMAGWPSKIFGALIGLMLWAPWLAHGWELQTWLVYPLTGLGCGFLWFALRRLHEENGLHA